MYDPNGIMQSSRVAFVRNVEASDVEARASKD